MKRLLTYLIPAMALMLGACSKQGDELAPETSAGTLTMRISTRAEAAGDGSYDPMEHLVVRIYNANGELIRKYASKEELPERLELIAGQYRVAVEAGEAVEASFTQRLYKGEEPFTVTAGKNTPVEVKCTLQNTAVATLFEESVAENFGSEFEVRVMAGDTFDADRTDAASTLRYTGDATGYFTLGEGVSSLSWRFRGEHPSRGTIEKSGTITDVKAPGRYTLTFRFSPDLPGFIDAVAIRVVDKTDDFDDTIIWSPDPTIKGDGFELSEKQQYTGGEKRFQITTVKPTATARMNFNGKQYDLLSEASTPETAGLSVVKNAENALTVTLSEAFFAGCPGGDHPLRLEVADNGGGQGDAECIFTLQGVLTPSAADCNLWNNTVTLRALVFDPAVSSVTFGLRSKGGQWQETAGSNTGDGTWSATFGAEWEESVNENAQTVYTPKAGTGVWADAEYECRVVIDGQESLATFSTAGGQSIPDGDMENGSLSCFTINNQNTSFWGSGNNNNTSSLCTQGAIDGNHYANMQSTYYIAAMAAGNLFAGTFRMSGTTGTVGFGQPYSYTARPRALRLNYHAQVGIVNNNGGNGPLAIDGQDRARIYVAIVDWSARHEVSSTFNILGSCTNSGTWDPTNGAETVSEGRILGYGSLWIEQSTEGNALVSSQDALRIYWYDKEAPAPGGNYTLVISCAANAYGDYFNGCDKNHLWVDDFQWVY
uniref:DUF4493 domain-containing protein n=1 Tax=Alistipes megaguti TaxID=2364787 RepID=UPI000EFD84A7|nr:DUF4493 domain-containing protein [Alistipes megaguti]